MAPDEGRAETALLLRKTRFQDLLDHLVQAGYRVIGPTVREGVVTYDEIHRVEQIPRGWVDLQEPGKYRLRYDKNNPFWFSFTPGPISLKRYLFPPTQTLFRVRRDNGRPRAEAVIPDPPRYAFLGVRGCDVRAVAVQDRVYIDRQGQFSDSYYAKARERCLIIAVECQTFADTCFCTSMGSGPQVQSGADLVLTELPDAFVVRSLSDKGQAIVSALELPPAAPEQVAEADQAVREAAGSMERRVDTTDIRNLLLRNLENPRWEEVAKRCIACANCTMVCPTCFCFTVQEVTDLSGENIERRRVQDSCFNPEFSYAFGTIVRQTVSSRYRQWLTHKFATWYDQFGTPGCVGCGRCITWCPVGIDVTEELQAIRNSDGERGASA